MLSRAQETIVHVLAGANPVHDPKLRKAGFHLPEDEDVCSRRFEKPEASPGRQRM